jgi:hypothetical protein
MRKKFSLRDQYACAGVSSPCEMSEVALTEREVEAGRKRFKGEKSTVIETKVKSVCR